jgi:hypothetical protein
MGELVLAGIGVVGAVVARGTVGRHGDRRPRSDTTRGTACDECLVFRGPSQSGMRDRDERVGVRRHGRHQRAITGFCRPDGSRGRDKAATAIRVGSPPDLVDHCETAFGVYQLAMEALRSTRAGVIPPGEAWRSGRRLSCGSASPFSEHWSRWQFGIHRTLLHKAGMAGVGTAVAGLPCT